MAGRRFSSDQSGAGPLGGISFCFIPGRPVAAQPAPRLGSCGRRGRPAVERLGPGAGGRAAGPGRSRVESVLRARETPLEDLASGRDWRLAEALLTLHAVADEACAGLGIALDASDAIGCVYRARGRELLARTGSLARIDARLLRVLPKVRTPPTGRPAFSRYACVETPAIEARWHKMPARHSGT